MIWFIASSNQNLYTKSYIDYFFVFFVLFEVLCFSPYAPLFPICKWVRNKLLLLLLFYLQKIVDLDEINPQMFNEFENGGFVIRASDTF